MGRDFTLGTYKALCKAILENNFNPVRFGDYISSDCGQNKTIIIRHDVDKNPQKALRMAIIESEYSIRSTYYFRKRSHIFKKEIISEIESLGHEIGYHYESLADSGGNIDKAIELFSKNLEEFREFCKVETVSMHGSPLSRYNNIAIWDHCDYTDYGILGEAYLSIDWVNLLFFTDAGGSWNSKANLRDKPIPVNARQKKIRNTNELIRMFNSDHDKNYYLNVHPECWNNGLSWYSEAVSKKIRNSGKVIYRGLVLRK